MAVDLSFLPDQGEGQDLSFLPDQGGTDLSFLPDQEQPKNILQRSAEAASNVFDPEKLTIGGDVARLGRDARNTAAYLTRPVNDYSQQSPHGDIRQAPGFLEDVMTTFHPDVIAPLTSQRETRQELGTAKTLFPITSLAQESAKDAGLLKSAALNFATPGAAVLDVAGLGGRMVGDLITDFLKMTRLAAKKVTGSSDTSPGGIKLRDIRNELIRGKTYGQMAQEYFAPKMAEALDQQIKEGVPPDQAVEEMTNKLYRAGFHRDLAEELIMTVFLFKNQAMKEIGIKPRTKADLARYAKLTADRAEIRGLRAMRDLRDPFKGQKQLPAPGQAGGKPVAAQAAGQVGEGPGFIMEAGQGFKRQIASPEVPRANIIEQSAALPRQVSGRPTTGAIDIYGKARVAQEPSKEVRMAQAVQEARGKEAAAVGEMNRAKMAYEKAYPKTPEGLPAPEGKRPIISEQAVGPKAGVGFTVEEPGAMVSKFKPKKGAPRQYGMGGEELEIGAKRRADVSAQEPMRQRVVKGAPVAKYGPKKPALPAPKAAPKGATPIEEGPIAGKGFVVGGSKGPGAGGQKPSVRKNIIEKSAEARAKTPRQVAIEKAAAEAKKARMMEQRRLRRNEMARQRRAAKKDKERLGKLEGEIDALQKMADVAESKGASQEQILRIEEQIHKRVAQMESIDPDYIKRSFLRDVADKKVIDVKNLSKQKKIPVKKTTEAVKVKAKAEGKAPVRPKVKKGLGKKGEARIYDDNGKPVSKGEAVTFIQTIDRLIQKKSSNESGYISSIKDQLYSPDKSAAISASKELRKIIRQEGQRGSAAAFGEGGAKKTSRAELEARAARQRAKIEAMKKEMGIGEPEKTVPGSVTSTGKPKRVKKSRKLLESERAAMRDPVEIELAKKVTKTGKDGKPYEAYEGGTEIGNIPVGKLLAQGEIDAKQAEQIVRAAKMDPSLLKRFPRISDSLRKGTKIKPETLKIFKDYVALTPEQRVAMADVPIEQGLAVLQNPNLDPITQADLAIEAVHNWQILRNAFGSSLRAVGRPRQVQAFIGKLRRLLSDTNLPKGKRMEIERVLDWVEKGQDRANLFDVIHEIGVNNMLASAVTIKRNLVGNLIGVSMQPGDKLGQAMLSLIPGTRNKASFREVPAMIVGMIKSLPRATERGFKFLRYGDTENIIASIVKKINKIRNIKGPATAAQRAKVAKLIKQAKFELSEQDVSRMAEIRSGRGQSFKAIRVFGSKFVRKHPKFSGVFDAIGNLANTASRILVGTDKFFGEISKGGVTAAAKVQKAMIARAKGVKVKAKDIRFTAPEKRALEEMAMEYVFRDKLGPTMTAASEFIGKIRPLGAPIGKALVPFFKTTVKLGRFVWNRSPFKFLEEGARMFYKGARPAAKGKPATPAGLTLRGFDAKEGGKALNGMAITAAVAAYVWGQKGRFVGVSKTKEERGLTRLRDLEEIRIEWLDNQGNVVGTLPMNNLLPATPFISALAAVEQGHIRIKKGEPEKDVYASESNAFFKSMLQQSVYNNLEEIHRATGSLLDEKVPVNEDGSVDQDAARNGLQRYFKRLIAGRSIPAQLREIKRTGKLFGMDIAEEDRTIYETSGEQLDIFNVPTGIPTAKAVGEEIRSGIPTFKEDAIFPFNIIAKGQKAGVLPSDKGLKGRVEFTGEVAQRSRRVTMDEIMGGGRKPTGGWKGEIYDELNRLEIFPGDAPQSKSISTGMAIPTSIKTRLTAQEQREFNQNTGPMIMQALHTFINHKNYGELPDAVKKKLVKNVIDFTRGLQSTSSGFQAFQRQLQSPEGRKQLDWDTFEGFYKFFTQMPSQPTK